MTTPNKSIQLSNLRKAVFIGIFLLMLSLIVGLCAEVILRSKGITPWRLVEVDVEVEPGGKFFTKHPTLGYTHIPGAFEVTLGTGYKFNVTHTPDTLRITHPIEKRAEKVGDDTDNSIENDAKEEIWIFGGSMTHGWSLNDQETFPWLLQERFPEYEFRNFGVSGYGTVHSLLQFREALKTETPRVAILAYARFHAIRNTFSRLRRKDIAQWNKLGPLVQPYARFDGQGQLQHAMADVVYREFPLMRYLSLVHFAEWKYNKFESISHRPYAVSRALVGEMASLARDHHVELIVANIKGANEMMRFAEKSGIANVTISVNSMLPENTNLPHDRHPSALANQKFADGLEPILKNTLAAQSARSR